MKKKSCLKVGNIARLTFSNIYFEKANWDVSLFIFFSSNIYIDTFKIGWKLIYTFKIDKVI